MRIGGVKNHKNSSKQPETKGQSWFPESWNKDDILLAGTYVANTQKPAIGTYAFDRYNNVRVAIIFDSNGSGSIMPDNSQQLLGDSWELKDDG